MIDHKKELRRCGSVGLVGVVSHVSVALPKQIKGARGVNLARSPL